MSHSESLHHISDKEQCGIMRRHKNTSKTDDNIRYHLLWETDYYEAQLFMETFMGLEGQRIEDKFMVYGKGYFKPVLWEFNFEWGLFKACRHNSSLLYSVQ